MINNNLNISFWKPVTLDYTPNDYDDIFSKYGYKIGSFFDRLVSIHKETINFKVQWLKNDRIDIQTGSTIKGYAGLFFTAIKISVFVITLLDFTIPTLIFTATALVIKYLYKEKLLDLIDQYKIVLHDRNQEPYHKTREVFCERIVGNNCKIELVYGDITKELSDIIVNAANADLEAGAGVCGAIHTAAGDGPFDECKEFLEDKDIRVLNCGDAMMTTSGILDEVKHIIHTVGPDFRIKQEKEKGWDYLFDAWTNPLKLAFEPQNHADKMGIEVEIKKGAKIICFPSISTGIFCADLIPNPEDPSGKSAPFVALEAIKTYFENNHLDIKNKVVRIIFLENETLGKIDVKKYKDHLKVKVGEVYRQALEKMIPLKGDKNDA